LTYGGGWENCPSHAPAPGDALLKTHSSMEIPENRAARLYQFYKKEFDDSGCTSVKITQAWSQFKWRMKKEYA
jgi:hypothetical protein